MTFDAESLARKNIQTLKPYSSARDEFSGEARIWLDANENPFGSVVGAPFHRYPDPLQKRLKKALAQWKRVDADSIFVGNGADEIIDLLVRAFCEPGRESILQTSPTYPMYAVVANAHNVAIKDAPLNGEFELDLGAIKKAIDRDTKIIFLCSPNNPTGNLLSRDAIEEILSLAPGLVVIDEAYVDFAADESWASQIKDNKNLVVLQTFSKSWGLAGLRVGVGYMDPSVVSILNRIKPPYNVNALSQEWAIRSLRAVSKRDDEIKILVSERGRLASSLAKINGIEKVYPSDANFLLVKAKEARGIYEKLLKEGIIIRDRSSTPYLDGCVRISVGTPYENNELLRVLGGAKELETKTERRGTVLRRTNETEVQVCVDLDGKGEANIWTGLGFLDHMLEQVAKHSGINLSIGARGDLWIDEHHTIEDIGIALGDAFIKALGDKSGIERYGFLLPMDEAEAKVSIDFSGRSSFKWVCEFKREKVGEVPTEMFEHFFRSFSESAKCALHIDAQGENDHHIVEAIYKGFARALKMAVRQSGENDVPSTKGVL